MKSKLDLASVLTLAKRVFLLIFKLIKDSLYILYVLAKRLLLLIDAYAFLYLINLGAKIIQFEFIFKKTSGFERFILMFGFRIALGLLLLFIYDTIKRNLFELEIKSSDKRKEFREKNSLLVKINNKVPWLEKIFQKIKNPIIDSKYYRKILLREWIQTLIAYCKRAIWIKKIGSFVKYIFFNLGIDPSVYIIMTRPGEKKYDGIKDFKIWIGFIIGSLLCTTALYITLSILKKIIF